MVKEYKNNLKEYYTRQFIPIEVNTSNKLFCGIEFEFIDNENAIFFDENGEEILTYNERETARNKENEHVIEWACNNELLAKHDGSVDIELVTPPLLIDDAKNAINKTLNFIENNSHFIAWDEGRCGMHIHINKRGIKSLKKLYEFFCDYKNIFKLLSGRKMFQYCSFNDNALYNNYKYRRGRYTALNFINEHTVEFRLWRGSLNKERCNMYLLISYLLCKYSHYLHLMTISEFLFLCNNDFLNSILEKNKHIGTIHNILNNMNLLKTFFEFKKWEINIKNILKFKKFKIDMNKFLLLNNENIPHYASEYKYINSEEFINEETPTTINSNEFNNTIDEAIPF